MRGWFRKRAERAPTQPVISRFPMPGTSTKLALARARIEAFKGFVEEAERSRDYATSLHSRARQVYSLMLDELQLLERQERRGRQ